MLEQMKFRAHKLDMIKFNPINKKSGFELPNNQTSTGWHELA